VALRNGTLPSRVQVLSRNADEDIPYDTHTHTHIYIYDLMTYTHTHIYDLTTHTRTYIYDLMTYTHTRTHTHIYDFMTHIYIWPYDTHTHIYIWPYDTHIYIHIYTHTDVSAELAAPILSVVNGILLGDFSVLNCPEDRHSKHFRIITDCIAICMAPYAVRTEPLIILMDLENLNRSHGSWVVNNTP
jgi:hypothetical protein